VAEEFNPTQKKEREPQIKRNMLQIDLNAYLSSHWFYLNNRNMFHIVWLKRIALSCFATYAQHTNGKCHV
jgi:hypothetical protein